PRSEDQVPEKRRPSCLFTVSVKAVLLSRGSPGCVPGWCGWLPPSTIDSLSPFQMPRRSGMAVCAAAGTIASAQNATVAKSFDINTLLHRRLSGENREVRQHQA